MWQRFKEVVDTKIQEEAARQRLEQRSSSIVSSPRIRPRAGSRPISPSRRIRRRETDGSSSVASEHPVGTGKGPDPSEFEPDFVIGDTSEISTRAGTPVSGPERLEQAKSVKIKANKTSQDGVTAGETKVDSDEDEIEKKVELPQDVQQRLKKLERLEPKYSELLRSYRVAHARISTIEAFEATLKEHTPLVSIADTTSFVEFLQQSSLKSDMLMEELKKSVNERDDLKKKVEAAALKAKRLETELESTKVDSISGEGIADAGKPEQVPEKDDDEFFSYESEMQNEVKGLESKITDLQKENTCLTSEISTSKHTVDTLTQSLNSARLELKTLRESHHKDEEITKVQVAAYTSEITSLKQTIDKHTEDINNRQSLENNLQQALKDQKALLAKQTQESNDKASGVAESISRLEASLTEAREATADEKKRSKTLQGLVEALRSQVQQAQTTPIPSAVANGASAGPQMVAEESKADTSSAGAKKKNKKKKKAGKLTEDAGAVVVTTDLPMDEKQSVQSTREGQLDLLQKELDSLHTLCSDKDTIISRLDARMKDQEGLLEEIETLRDEVINLGQDSVDSKAEVKSLRNERLALQASIAKLEEQITKLESSHDNATNLVEAHDTMKADFDRLKSKADNLGIDLAAAQKLAATRFKDLSELRDVLQKVQPELQSLRAEVSDLRKSKEEFLSKSAEVRKLEVREKDLRAELTKIKKQLSDRDSEVRSATDKLTIASNGRRDTEDLLRKTQRDLKHAQMERQNADEARERESSGLKQNQVDLRAARNSIAELENQLNALTTEASGIRDELTLKSAQYASAQSMMTSMQDQTQELSAQMRETKERCESLEEELGDAHRLLGERGREAESMRRLLADVDGRAEQRVRDMQERLDAAIEERDKAEDQAGIVGRRRAKEIEDLKNKVRHAEASLRKAESAKEEVEMQENVLRRQKEEMEARKARADDEVAEVREAMARLRDALDEAENTSRDMERERTELRQSLEETAQRLEKLQKSNKSMSEELKALQNQHDAANTISRTSLESSPSASRLATPPPRNVASPAGQAHGKIDYVYLKNVLLQFMEQKDKKHQMALVPVLGMLLHFDGKDEQKWMSAIKAT